MRFSDLSSKEIINIHDGSRLGIVGDADMIIECETGQIKALVIPPKMRLFRAGDKKELIIPWDSVEKVGDDIFLVDLDYNKVDLSSY